VFDLAGGRATWTALGLPTEGSVGDRGRVASVVESVDSVPFHASMADVRERAPNYPVAVLGRNGVLVGAIDSSVDSMSDDIPVADVPVAEVPVAEVPVAEVMVPAPRTIRGELRVDDVVKRLKKDGLDRVFVTSVSGVLLGQVTLEKLEGTSAPESS
jgi:CBS domain-containing protein